MLASRIIGITLFLLGLMACNSPQEDPLFLSLEQEQKPAYEIHVVEDGVLFFLGTDTSTVLKTDHNGEQLSIFTHEAGVYSLVANDEHLFWTNQEGSVVRALHDGTMETTLSQAEQPPLSLCPVDNGVAWVEDRFDGGLWRPQIVLSSEPGENYELLGLVFTEELTHDFNLLNPVPRTTKIIRGAEYWYVLVRFSTNEDGVQSMLFEVDPQSGQAESLFQSEVANGDYVKHINQIILGTESLYVSFAHYTWSSVVAESQVLIKLDDPGTEIALPNTRSGHYLAHEGTIYWQDHEIYSIEEASLSAVEKITDASPDTILAMDVFDDQIIYSKNLGIFLMPR